MKTIHVKNGYNIRLEGAPEKTTETVARPFQVAVLPEKIPFIKPRLLVSEGDAVSVGSHLFEDKRNPKIKFASPGGGKISRIAFGERRVLQEIVIDLGEKETFLERPAKDASLIMKTDRSLLIEEMKNGGMWPLIRELPYRDIAKPYKRDDKGSAVMEIIPPLVMVIIGGNEPFTPCPEMYLKDDMEAFNIGLAVLKKVGSERIVIASDPETAETYLKNMATHVIEGPYAAYDPAVILYYIRKEAEENRAWYIDGQDVVLIGRFFMTGSFPINRIISISGSHVKRPGHLVIRSGSSISHIIRGRVRKTENKDLRYVSGGVFSGLRTYPKSYMGYYEKNLLVFPEGNTQEAFGFLKPGYEKPSYSRTFLSVFNNKEMKMDASLHGGERACVNCGYCAEVCPVEILPQYTYKSVYAGEIEESLKHGLLDCAECGLCSYVCTSKIDLRSHLAKAKAAYYKEQGGLATQVL